jgi:copper resistance protein B
VRPGAAQTWAAFGVQGLAPYWFDVQVTAYVGAGGRTQLEADVEYDLLLTNRLILQPRVGALVSGTADPERGLGAGLGSTELGVRMRYEIRREFAPYLGVSWDRLYGGTAEAVRAGGGTAGRARLVGGVRAWF